MSFKFPDSQSTLVNSSQYSHSQKKHFQGILSQPRRSQRGIPITIGSEPADLELLNTLSSVPLQSKPSLVEVVIPRLSDQERSQY
jgi:hypothetical protein